MAVEREIRVPIRREERTDEVIIQAPITKGYFVRVLRITRDYFEDGKEIEISRRYITRDMSKLILDAEAVPLLTALPAIFDRWANEDDAAAEAAP
jgi:hypothetical protein